MQAPPTAGRRAVRLVAPPPSTTATGAAMEERGVGTSPTLAGLNGGGQQEQQPPQQQQRVPRPPSASRRAVSLAGDVGGGGAAEEGPAARSVRIDDGGGGNSTEAGASSAIVSRSPAAKRVGFHPTALPTAGDADGGAEPPAAPSSFAGVSRRKAEQLRREQSDGQQQRGQYGRAAREVDAAAADALPALPDGDGGALGATDAAAADPGGHMMMPRAPRKGGLARASPNKRPLGGGDDGGFFAATGAPGTAAADTTAGLDLSLLTAHLCPPEMVAADESDTEWEPDALLAALAAELAPGRGGGGAQPDRDELRQI